MASAPAHTQPERGTFVAAMARAVNGVAVVATDGPAGRCGLTVSSVASVSADPPLVLACVNRGSPAHAAVRDNGVFSINLLSTRQQELSDAFAGRPARGPAYRFDARRWSVGASGAPLLEDAVAALECVVEQAHDAGSHTVFIGRVIAVTPGSGEPLLYTARAYGRAVRWTPEPTLPDTTEATPHRCLD